MCTHKFATRLSTKVWGVGAETVGQTANVTGVALATRLGVKPMIFPGDHNGYGPQADKFAGMLREIFTEHVERTGMAGSRK